MALFNTLIGSTSFGQKSGGELPQRGKAKGFWSGSASEVLAGGTPDCTAAVVFTPSYRIQIVQISGVITYRALGAGVVIYAPCLITLAPYVTTGQGFTGIPARMASGVITPLLAQAASAKFYSDNGQPYQFAPGVILEANTQYELVISNSFRTWQATDTVDFYAALNWEVV